MYRESAYTQIYMYRDSIARFKGHHGDAGLSGLFRQIEYRLLE